jgi:hypothetical protein
MCGLMLAKIARSLRARHRCGVLILLKRAICEELEVRVPCSSSLIHTHSDYSYNVTSEELFDLFGKFGPIRYAFIAHKHLAVC